MTFLDFSDSEEMFGLLLDFVSDEEADCGDDPERQAFLSQFRRALIALTAGRIDEGSLEVTARLRDLQESVDREFADDPVTGHLRDCLEELERLDGYER